MATLFGAIGLQDSDYFYNNTVGQRIVYDESERLLAYYNQDVAASRAIWVGDVTWMHNERYKLPGSGRLQRRGRQSRPAYVKATGQWDVGYPLEDFAAGIGADDVTLAYMTLAEYDRHFQTILVQNANTTREEILRAIFNNTTRPFVDELWGTINVQPLANGDATLYPPVIGTTTEATENNYLVSGYAAAAISNTNNPLKTIVRQLQRRFGTPTAGADIAVFYHSDQDDAIRGLASFVPEQYRYTQAGTQTATPIIPGMPDVILKGTWEITGTAAGCILAKWDFIPTGYMLAINLSAPPPLKVRIDPPQVGLGAGGLQLVATEMEWPFRDSYWRNRFGVGCANRLNGVVMQLTTNPTYAIPAAYI